MAEQSGFFDAHASADGSGNVVYDRTYLAESFAKYFASFIGNGVFGGKSSELLVKQKETADMSIRVLPGQAFINGYFYENTDELVLPIDNANGVLSRIDLIVLRWDKNERAIHLVVEKGPPASSPSAPLLKRNDDIYDLELAKVTINAGATRISQIDIVDTRLDTNVCGFVTGVVDQLDTTEFSLHLNAWIEQFKLDSIADVENLLVQLRTILANNDLGPIILDIQKLQQLSIESAEYPGCYYRVVNGSTEWLNPPTEPGIEYRLTDRFEGKPVYQMLVHIASLPDTSLMIVTPDFMLSKIVSIEGVVFDSEDSYTGVYPFPVFMSSSAVPDAIIVNVMPGLAWTNLAIMTAKDMTRYQADIIVKYVK